MSRLRVTVVSSSATTGSSCRGGKDGVASFDWNTARLRSRMRSEPPAREASACVAVPKVRKTAS
jgi:hypothetical protein